MPGCCWGAPPEVTDDVPFIVVVGRFDQVEVDATDATAFSDSQARLQVNSSAHPDTILCTGNTVRIPSLCRKKCRQVSREGDLKTGRAPSSS